MSKVNLRDIKGLAWEYYLFHRHRDKVKLIEDLQHVQAYIEHIIQNIGASSEL